MVNAQFVTEPRVVRCPKASNPGSICLVAMMQKPIPCHAKTAADRPCGVRPPVKFGFAAMARPVPTSIKVLPRGDATPSTHVGIAVTFTTLTAVTDMSYQSDLATRHGAERLAAALGITHGTGMVACGAKTYFVMFWHTIPDPDATFWEGCEVEYRQDPAFKIAA